MGVKFFGMYLVDRKVITREQLLEALEEQRSKNLKFGEHAVRLGLIKESDIEKIKEIQKSKDLRFGEAAVQLGLLTYDQVEQIQRIQRSSHKLLGDILVEKGIITPAALERELSAFEDEQRVYMTETVFIPEGVRERESIGVLIDLTKKFLLRVVGINTKFGDFDFIKWKEADDYSVSVKFSGDVSFVFVLNVPEVVVVKLICEYNFKETEENKRDALREFANVICGNTVAKLERLGKKVDITPPQDLSNISGKAFRYKLTGADLVCNLYFFE